MYHGTGCDKQIISYRITKMTDLFKPAPIKKENKYLTCTMEQVVINK